MAASADDRLLDAVYRTWGKPATYTAPGELPVDCTIQVYRPGIVSRQSPFEPIGITGHVDVGIAELAVVVRASEVVQPAEDGVFQTYLDQARTEPGTAYRIGAPLPYDPDGVEWRCPSST